MSVEEYTREFEKLVIKCDLHEPVLILGMLMLFIYKLTLLLMSYVC